MATPLSILKQVAAYALEYDEGNLELLIAPCCEAASASELIQPTSDLLEQIADEALSGPGKPTVTDICAIILETRDV